MHDKPCSLCNLSLFHTSILPSVLAVWSHMMVCSVTLPLSFSIVSMTKWSELAVHSVQPVQTIRELPVVPTATTALFACVCERVCVIAKPERFWALRHIKYSLRRHALLQLKLAPQRHCSQPLPLFADWAEQNLTWENLRIYSKPRRSTEGNENSAVVRR